MNELLDILAYKREALIQLLLVATIFGAFSMSALTALLVSNQRDRLHQFMFVTLTIASLAFIFATTLDAILIPVMGRKANGALKPEQIQGLLRLGDSVVWGTIIGAIALVVSIGSFGFTFSRKIGIIVCMTTILILGLLFEHFWRLAHLL